MGVAAEIGQHLLGAAERRLGVDHPLDPPQLAEPAGEGGRDRRGRRARRRSRARRPRRRRAVVEEQPAEEPREHADRQEEAGPAGDPARRRRATGRRRARRNGRADDGAGSGPRCEARRRGRSRRRDASGRRRSAQRLGRRPEQDGVDRLLVLEGDLGDRRRQREHDMEIRHRQQLGLPGGQPCGAGLALALRAMPVAAGVVGDADQAAIRAVLGMAAQRRRPAQLDGAHHAPLDAAEMTVMGAAIGVAVAAEDIRHFQTGRHGAAGSGGRHHLQRQPVERALGSPDRARSRPACSAPCSTGWRGRAGPG